MLKPLVYAVIRNLIFVLCLAGILFYGILMVKNAMMPDLGWLLQTGHYILKHHQIPSHDVFSWTHPDKPWVLYQWLFEVLVAWMQANLGEQLMMRLFIVTALLTYIIAPLRVAPQRVPALLVLCISVAGLVASSITLTLRPMIFSSIFLLLQYVMLQHYRQGRWPFKKTLLLMGIMYALWGNLHMGVTVGLGAMGLAALGDWMEQKGLYHYQPHPDDSPETRISVKQYGVFALCATLASFLNPYGPGIYGYLFDLSSQTYLNDLIHELQSPNFHNPGFFPFLIAYFILPFVLMRPRQVMPARDFLTLLVFNLVTLYIARFVVWVCLFAALILPKALYDWWQYARYAGFLKDLFETRNDMYKTASITIILAGCVAFLAFPQAFPTITQGECGRYKAGILAYQQLKQPGDRVLNNDMVGSCMIMYTPEEKVFIDTRFDFYTDSFTKEVVDILILTPQWEQLFDKWQINTVLLSKTCILASRTCPIIDILKRQKGFQQIYDDQAMVILRHPALGRTSATHASTLPHAR